MFDISVFQALSEAAKTAGKSVSADSYLGKTATVWAGYQTFTIGGLTGLLVFLNWFAYRVMKQTRITADNSLSLLESQHAQQDSLRAAAALDAILSVPGIVAQKKAQLEMENPGGDLKLLPNSWQHYIEFIGVHFPHEMTRVFAYHKQIYKAELQLGNFMSQRLSERKKGCPLHTNIEDELTHIAECAESMRDELMEKAKPFFMEAANLAGRKPASSHRANFRTLNEKFGVASKTR